MSHPSPWLHPVCCYKRSLQEEEGLAFAFWGFTLGILVWEAFGREKSYGRENAKEGLIESLH
jgi:hypothetical protein